MKRSGIPYSAVVFLLLAAGLVFFFQVSLDRSLPSEQDERSYLLVPPLEVVRAVASGFNTVIADVFWLDFLQYNGEKLISDRPYKDEVHNIGAMLFFITDLDPRFTFAYQFGGWALADAYQEADAARLLDRGHRALPRDAMIPFQRGFVEFLFRHDYNEAARWFMIADRLPGCPPRARRMAASMYAKVNKKDLARATWQEILDQAKDLQTRRIAERHLEMLRKEGKK
ncbi:MAG TPA: hypothetical protein DD435_03920 [Cyanobacteria bacterium UBA8530]|nr:hypothetical protein [Cyanobacteria bacterium UBA8530]